MPMAKLIEVDLFVIVRVAIEVIEKGLLEEPEINQSIWKQWNEFKNAVTWMQTNKEPIDSRPIRETYYRFKSSLRAIEY